MSHDTGPKATATISLHDRVWYVCYGSNLSYDRFIAYIAGKRSPDHPNGPEYPACKDTTPPSKQAPVPLHRAMYFAKKSRTWDDGGVAFVSLEQDSGNTLARAYLITLQQFEHLAIHENKKVTLSDLTLNIGDAIKYGHSRLLPRGFYDELLYLGSYGGYAKLSITHSTDVSGELNKPFGPYLRRMGIGLRETYDLTLDEIVNYLKDVPVVGYSDSDLRRTLRMA